MVQMPQDHASSQLASGEGTGLPHALSTMRAGQEGVIAVSGTLAPEDAAVLRAMGLRPQTRIRLCRVGEPCIVRVIDGRGCACRIGLARRLADQVMVGNGTV